VYKQVGGDDEEQAAYVGEVAPVEGFQQVGDGDRDDECPVGCHDVHLVDAEAKSHVQSHVVEEEGEGCPEEALAESTDDAKEEEKEDEALYNIVNPEAVMNYHRAIAQNVFHQIVFVEN